MALPENRCPLFGTMRFRLRMTIFRPPVTAFRGHALAEKKCAASPGGTFFILLPAPALSTQPERSDSIVPQGRILKENLLVASQGGLQQLAGESLPIVASWADSTTSRAIERFQSIPDAFASGAFIGRPTTGLDSIQGLEA